MQIFYFATADWESYHRKEMIKTLARVGGDNVEFICINRPIDFFITPIKHISKFLKWLWGKDRFEKIYDNMYIYTPLLLIHDLIATRIPILNSLLISSLRKQILKRVSVRNLKEIVCWISSPNQGHFIELFPDSTVVYDVYDELTLTSDGNENKRFKILEEIILNRADIIFATSENLYHTKREKNPEVHYIPNGINKDLLNFASLPMPAEISEIYKDIPSPRIGYLGLVRDWMDFTLLRSLAIDKPNYSFVFIGSIDKHAPINKISNLKNVFFLDTVNYNLIMFHLRQMDACIIPFRINKFMINCCPYKLFEYLAAGKPIVSTDLPEVKKFSPYAKTAQDKKEFVRLLEEAVKISPDYFIPPEIIEENLWEKRVEQMLKVLEERVNSR